MAFRNTVFPYPPTDEEVNNHTIWPSHFDGERAIDDREAKLGTLCRKDTAVVVKGKIT